MRRVRYSVAMSLDGFITDADGKYDWIVMDPDIDFNALTENFDTALMGRKTYETVQQQGGVKPNFKNYVFSNTLNQTDCPDVTVSNKPTETIAELKAKPGKDIWLFGGGSLFHSLLELGQVDTVEVTVIPVILGGGTPLLPQTRQSAKLKLIKHKVYEKTGTLSLEYEVV